MKSNPMSEKKRLPLVSFIVPVYNAEKYISLTLSSILNQTIKEIEILVVNDGSSDKSQKIIDSFACRDSRIRVFNQSQRGVASARNHAIQYAKGEYIAPIDSDDIWHPHALKMMLACFSRNDPKIGLVYTWSLMIDENNRLKGTYIISNAKGNVLKRLIYSNFIGNASATLIRRHCFDVVGNYSLNYRELNAEGCEDWDLYLRIAEHFYFDYVPKFLVGYRSTIGNMSSNLEQMNRSHALVMLSAQQRNPHLASILFKVSASHFRIYLAKLSKQTGQFNKMLKWLGKAREASVVGTFFYFQFYLLFINALYGKVRENVCHLEKQQIADGSNSEESIGEVFYNKNILFENFDTPNKFPLEIKTKLIFFYLANKINREK